MKNKDKEIDYSKEIPFIRKACAHLSEKEMIEAEERFRKHIRICFEIIEDTERELRSYKNFKK